MSESSAFDRASAALEARGPGRMVPDLSRISELAGMLGDPQLAYPTVHVTGTNGKGSTVRMVGSLCAAAGIAAGTYTSPHLQTVRERLTLAGRHITPARFASVYDEVVPIAELVDERARASDGPDADTVTYFELLTAMAFAWFADAPVDVGVFEVGMGGRWDATNVVRGDVAVLNEIDVDHRELGASAAEVAGEKVGIIKPGAHVVSAVQSPAVEPVVEQAVAQADATYWRAGREFDVAERQVAVGGQLLALRVGERVVDEVLLPLHGAHQARNAALALAAFAAFTGDAFHVMDDEVIRNGLGAVQVPGRLEVVRRDPTVVLDGAHNPHGARAAVAALDAAFGFREVVLVVACLDDKDVQGILGEFRTAASHVIVTRAPSFRAASLLRMQAAAVETWEGTGVVVETADDLTTALDMAEAVVEPGDGVLVAGSLHTVGAARERYLPEGLFESDSDQVVRDPADVAALEAAQLEDTAAALDDDEAFDAAVRALLDGDGEEDDGVETPPVPE